MSMLRLFFTNTYLLASAGKWDLLAEYFTLTSQIMTSKEVRVIPGTPVNKEKVNG